MGTLSMRARRQMNPDLADWVQRVIDDVRRLKPMPPNIARVMRLLDDPNVSTQAIASAIGLDQALAAQLLKLANSAFYGGSRPSSTIHEAVVRVGFDQIRVLLLGVVTMGPLSKRLMGYRMAKGQLWEHALLTAASAKVIAQRVAYAQPEEAYVAGLLHDIGKLTLDQLMRAEAPRVRLLADREGMPDWQIEEQLFGIDHSTIGGMMAERWKFPPPLSYAIQYHHAPTFAPRHMELAAIVNIGNAISGRKDPQQADKQRRRAHPEALRLLGIDTDMLLHELCEEAYVFSHQLLGAEESDANG